MKKIKIAQIGTGHDHAIGAIASLKNLSDTFELVGYATEDEGHSNPCADSNHANYNGVPQMTVEDILNYPDLDAVVIETEDCYLTKYALMAAEKGLHIQMDKPGSQSAEEFSKLVQLVKEKNLVFQLGYMYRYNKAIQEAIAKVKSGELGEIYSVEAQMNCLHKNDKRTWLKNYKGGMLFFLGCHLIDLIYQIQGEPEEIIPLSASTEKSEINGAEDYGMVAFRYKNGVSFAKTCGNEAGGFMRRQLNILGTKGTLELFPLEYYSNGNICTDMYHTMTDFSKAWDSKKEKITINSGDRYISMFEGFAKMVRGEIQNPYSYEYEQKLHNIILKSCGL